MDQFEASNGVTVWRDSGTGNLRFSGDAIDLDNLREKLAGASRGFSPAAEVALREFFRAERDEELGRWRWPENPDYVVYPSDQFAAGEAGAWVRVVHEATSFVEEFARHATARATRADMLFPAAAHAYFDAHPERKPWHDAKPGEVWVVTEGDLSETYPYLVDDEQFYDSARDYALNFNDPAITAARRIWPEVSGE